MKKTKLLAVFTAVSMLCGMISVPVIAEEAEAKAPAAVAASVRAYLEENGYSGETLENAMAVYEIGAEYALDEFVQPLYKGFYDEDDQGSDLLFYETICTTKYEFRRYIEDVGGDYIRIAANLDHSIGDYVTDPILGEDVVVTETPVDYQCKPLTDFYIDHGIEFVFENFDLGDDVPDSTRIDLLTFPISKYNNRTSKGDSIRDGSRHMYKAYPDDFHIMLYSQCYVMGDVNHDGMVNPTDYTVGLRLLAGEYPSNDFVYQLFPKSADMDMNGEVTVSDLEAIFDLSYYTEALTANYAYADRLAEEDESLVAEYLCDNGFTNVYAIKDTMNIYREGKNAEAISGAVKAPETGDINCDGAVNAIDYTEMMRYLTDQAAEVYAGTVFDINGDGEINYADAAAIPKLNTYSAISEVSIVYGDMNIDGEVTMADVAYMHKCVMNIINMNAYQKKAADCYADGIINIDDITTVVQHLLGMTPELPFKM